MLLILGQPGIGKSTLITWIAANFSDRFDDILVYKFASDLANMDWKNDRIYNRLLDELGFSYDDLKEKTLILDGFDEVSINNSRKGRNVSTLHCNRGMKDKLRVFVIYFRRKQKIVFLILQ